MNGFRTLGDAGVPASPSGYSSEPEPSCTVSAVPVSIPNANGRSINCGQCGGHGLVLSMCGEPDECCDCGGSGRNWQYSGGAIARYYSGPLIGRGSPSETPNG